MERRPIILIKLFSIYQGGRFGQGHENPAIMRRILSIKEEFGSDPLESEELGPMKGGTERHSVPFSPLQRTSLAACHVVFCP